MEENKMIESIQYYLKNPVEFFYSLGEKTVFKSLSDEKYLKIMYKHRMGKELNLDNPVTYCEKLQWLKLNGRNPLYSTLVDKYEVKKYVADLIGEKYIIKTLGVWDSFDDIDFDKLPNSFVLKCTHDSGGISICKNRESFNFDNARKKINKCLRTDYYLKSREWPYKAVKPRIIAEEYMEDASTKELRDYKFFCFGGEVKLLFVASERQKKEEETKFDFFDMDFNHLDFTNGHPNAKKLPEKPDCFDEMKRLATILSQGMPHVRVDFYEVNGRVYFGEITFFHWSGMMPFRPEKWDRILGDWIQLPINNGGER
jgi:hypothetical protein